MPLGKLHTHLIPSLCQGRAIRLMVSKGWPLHHNSGKLVLKSVCFKQGVFVFVSDKKINDGISSITGLPHPKRW